MQEGIHVYKAYGYYARIKVYNYTMSFMETGELLTLINYLLTC